MRYEPKPQIWDMECIKIDKGEVERLKQAYAAVGNYDLSDPDCVLHQKAESLYRNMKIREAESHNDRSVVAQWDDMVEMALRRVTSLVVSMMTGFKNRHEKSMVGDIKKRLNRRKKHICGPKEKDVANLKRHYQWIKDFETELTDSREVPEWLK